MLEMSNGYQASSSPALVNSPTSPGQLVMSPSPTPKALNTSNRATPPPRHHSPRPNLRIVMPNAPSHHEDNNVVFVFLSNIKPDPIITYNITNCRQTPLTRQQSL